MAVPPARAARLRTARTRRPVSPAATARAERAGSADREAGYGSPSQRRSPSRAPWFRATAPGTAGPVVARVRRAPAVRAPSAAAGKAVARAQAKAAPAAPAAE